MINKSYRKIVGIMIGPSQIKPPFAQQRFFAHLCELGSKWGFLVFVFSPIHFDVKSATVQGYKYQSSAWVKAAFPLPDLIYDRAFFEGLQQYHQHLSAVHIMMQIKKIPYLGRGLKGKWSVHQVLIKHSLLAEHLPPTVLLRQPSHLFRLFKAYPTLILKPAAGSQGKGVVVITKSGAAAYSIRGRTMNNQTITMTFSNPFSCLQWLLAFIGKRSYLVQKFLSLQTDDGNAYDIRVLMQKGSDGYWGQTGMAARIGQPASVTSNIHGGGKGAHVYPMLANQFDPKQAEAIIATITQLSLLIPPLLEQHFGRLVELGLDIGIDQAGKVWIIEVNSKPGRATARWFTEPFALDRAMSNPMQYARFLLSVN
jgi:glutathione synthase/RimK-type ligase-like ATP-grasp enzyme